MERKEQSRCRELAMPILVENHVSRRHTVPCSFSRSIYSEIEEVGWEHLLRLGGDMTFLSFHILDKTGRVHIVEVQLDKTYPKTSPSISADLPFVPNLEWSRNSRLKDLVRQFQEHVDKFQEFWSTLDDIDKSLWVTDPNKPSRAISSRQINIGDDCFIMLFINPNDPRSLPDCVRHRFVGPCQTINFLTKIWKKNSKRWTKEKPFLENLAFVLETQLPRPPDVHMNDQQVECGICYAQCLPIDDELDTKLEIGTDYICDNSSCGKAFHSICLAEWLRSITTTRQSFNVLFGKCPYCSEPVAVKIGNPKK